MKTIVLGDNRPSPQAVAEIVSIKKTIMNTIAPALKWRPAPCLDALMTIYIEVGVRTVGEAAITNALQQVLKHLPSRAAVIRNDIAKPEGRA